VLACRAFTSAASKPSEPKHRGTEAQIDGVWRRSVPVVKDQHDRLTWSLLYRGISNVCSNAELVTSLHRKSHLYTQLPISLTGTPQGGADSASVVGQDLSGSLARRSSSRQAGKVRRVGKQRNNDDRRSVAPGRAIAGLWAGRTASLPPSAVVPRAQPRPGRFCRGKIAFVSVTWAPNRELIFGLISPIGVNREPVISAFRNELSKVRYGVHRVHVSDTIAAFAGRFSDHDYVARKNALMDAGNRLRKWHKSGDAAALLSILEIGKTRRGLGFPRNILNPNAYVVDSIKHPDEVRRFQATYGPAFIGVGLYEPPLTRRHRISAEARDLLHEPDASAIDKLMSRDEDEGVTYGQKVRNAFELADFILDLSAAPGSIDVQIWRLIRCLFGDVQVTPTIEEYGMSLARSAQAKSGSLARQVGAAIVRGDGSVVAVAANEVARPGGGQYTEGDDLVYPRGRDVNRDKDSSDYYRHKALTDLIKRLQTANALARRHQKTDADELFKRWWNSQEDPWLRQAFQASTIDYVRAVHAEMAVITDAARNGVELRGTTLYSTTFPCHDCAKHIVAAGLRQVVYLAPYPKSLVAELYDDSIEINASSPSGSKVQFRSFVGMAPTRYDEFFLVGKRDRKDDEGRPHRFDASKPHLALPTYAPDPKSVIVAETDSVGAFASRVKQFLTSRRSQTTSRKIRSKR
jgi:deoxycytidylate deaminase